MPLVSVVMPVRNAARFLEEAAESVLAQGLADLELIAVDDGSSDETPAVLRALAARDPRLKILTTPAAGIVPALQAGIAAAKGEFVARMDADDIAATERLERQVAALRADPSLALIGSAITLIDEAGHKLREVSYPASPAEIRLALPSRNCFAHPTVLMRRDALLAVGGYRSAFALCEDYDLWLRLAERFDLANLPEPLLRYRLHPGQSSWTRLEQRIVSELAAASCAAHSSCFF